MMEVSTRAAHHYVVHWVSKKHWSKPGFDFETSDFPTMARRAKNLEDALARAKGEIEAGAAIRDHVEVYGVDREGCAVASYWIEKDGAIGSMDMDG